MKKFKLVILVSVIALGVLGGYFWFQYQKIHPSTSDAYLEANSVYVSPQISGQVSKVAVKSYQSVHKGDVLLEIDPSQFRLALANAKAQLNLAKTQAVTATADEKTAKAEARDALNVKNFQKIDYDRVKSLSKKGLASQQQADDSLYKLKEAIAKYEAAESEINSAQARLQQASAQIQVAQVAIDKAKLDLTYTQVIAPADGVLGEVSVQPGQYVSVGEKLFPMVRDNDFWVAANFKETDLAHIKAGQPAQLELDMYPDHVFNGEVESISPASGVAFSLIPAQNATGNWVKVTQRFPVRIHLKAEHLTAEWLKKLRIGASVDATIDASH